VSATRSTVPWHRENEAALSFNRTDAPAVTFTFTAVRLIGVDVETPQVLIATPSALELWTPSGRSHQLSLECSTVIWSADRKAIIALSADNRCLRWIDL
jgi:hypothetical protein